MTASTTAFAIALAATLGFAPHVGTTGPADAPPCRCAQLTLERYWEDADIVVVGRVTAVRPFTGDNAAASSGNATDVPPSAGLIAVSIRPQFRQGRTFKGSLDNVTLVTADNTASCGVPVVNGATYIIFATHDRANPGTALFNTCSGSRQYPDAQNRAVALDFVGTPDNRVVPRLFELADAPAQSQQQQSPIPDFHTSPACWDRPRIVHTGSPAADLRERLRLRTERMTPPDTGAIVSPNGGYAAFSQWTPPDTNSDSRAVVFIDVERPYTLRLDIAGPRGAPHIEWINEKLLFVRVAWGRIAFTDVIVDVEQSRIIYEEAATDGQIAFQQYGEACIGQCPCFVVPGSVDSLPAPPRHAPAPDEANAIDILELRPMTFLDSDWDGRVFTTPASRLYTVSALHQPPDSVPSASASPVDVLEVQEIDGIHWLKVAIYRESPCTDPTAAPVHTGWVPAFSATGRFVIGTWPGGCAP